MALIADYYEENTDSVVMTDYGGAGESLTIPGFLIDHESSLLIEDNVNKGQSVILSAQLTIQKPDDELIIGLLYSSSLDLNA